MAKTQLGGQEIEVDEDGFIQEPEKWNKEVAEDLAKLEHASPMGEEHWKLVNYLRDYYLKYEIAPPVRMLVKQTGSRPQEDIPAFPGRACEGGVQGGRPSQADGLRIGRLPEAFPVAP